MPNWKPIPTLKTLALRNVAWPDGVFKPVNARKHYPTVETYVRNTLVEKFFREEKRKRRKKRQRNDSTKNQSIRNITEDVLNAWIRLSNFYETRLSEVDSMAMFMRMSTIGTLDFLHEGFTFRDEKNFWQNIFPYIGVVPQTLKPQCIDYRTWHDIINVMVMEDVCETLENLYVSFGNEKTENEKIKSELDFYASSRVYKFEETMECFVNLKTLVVRGDAVTDNFMLAVGENCCFLERLDIRGTQVTDRGVALLLFQKLGRRFFRGGFLPTHCRFPVFPSEILRPCCATLKYLDVSDVQSSYQSGSSYKVYIARACPQLRPTPLRCYYRIKGQTKVILEYNTGPLGLAVLREDLIRYVTQAHCEILYQFAKVLIECMHFEFPRLEVFEDQLGEETAFLFRSGSAMVLHCELENLVILNLISYSRSVLSFIPINLIAKFAPNLKKLKASLSGGLSADTPMDSLKYVSAPAIKWVDTLESITEHCPKLQYIEVRDILMMNTATQFGNDEVEDIFQKDEYPDLEVVRFLFTNKTMLHTGLSWIATRCPSLRIVGDLSLWAIPHDTLLRIFANSGLNNYNFVIEYEGVLHYCDNRNRIDLARFE